MPPAVAAATQSAMAGTAAPAAAGAAATPSPAATAMAATTTPAATAAATQAAAAAATPAAATGAAAAPTATSATATPCATSAATATATPTTSAGPRVPVTPGSFANGQPARFQLGDVATAPVDGQGNAIDLNQTAAQATTSMNCTLIIPANPLTAAGLATPYQLGDGCSEANPNEQAFAEATILSPNGQMQVYNPLVITQGTTPAAAPVTPTIPAGAQVILDFGFNGTNLVLTGPGAMQPGSHCVDALGQSLIGEVSACNAVSFYSLANAEIARGTLKVPAAGTSLDGQTCETTRDFALIDQDQSDNINSVYLLNGNGQTAQSTAANKNAMGGAALIANGSDNALLSFFVDPANGCTPFTQPDMTAANGASPSQALNELSARVNQKGTIAVTPVNDEMALVNANFSVAKTNVYRSIVDQPLLAGNVNPAMVAAAYCMNMVNIAPARNQLDTARDANFTSPVPAVGTNLATFMGNRLSMSFVNLGCKNYGLTNPVTVTLDGNGVATAVTYNTAKQQATIPAAMANGGGRGGRGRNGGNGRNRNPLPRQRRGGNMQNPSRM